MNVGGEAVADLPSNGQARCQSSLNEEIQPSTTGDRRKPPAYQQPVVSSVRELAGWISPMSIALTIDAPRGPGPPSPAGIVE